MYFMASISLGRENWSTGMGAGPTPLAWTWSPQKGWSPKKGTIAVGHCIISRTESKIRVDPIML